MARVVRERVMAAARKAAVKRAAGEVSVADVARVAGVSWPTANRHLGGKTGLDALLGAPPVAADPANTRERLLAAAARCVAQGGVDGASLDAVSEEAGVTKGALYWHFDTKAALIEALVAQAAAPTAVTSAAAAIAHALQRDAVDAALDVELVAAARDPAVRSTLAQRRATERAHLTTALGLRGPRADAEAAVVQALLDGLAAARRIEPELDTGAVAQAALDLLGHPPFSTPRSPR